MGSIPAGGAKSLSYDDLLYATVHIGTEQTYPVTVMAFSTITPKSLTWFKELKPVGAELQKYFWLLSRQYN